MHLRLTMTALAAGAALALGACGDDSKSSSEGREESASPAVALREVGETREALTAALATYADGDRAKAEDQVAEAYVSHYEEVEHALDERDHELNEGLEEAISGNLRRMVKAGKPEGEVRAAFEDVLADLQKAEAALR